MTIFFFIVILLIPATMIGFGIFAFRNYNLNMLGGFVIKITAVQIVGLFLPIVPTEITLRKRFDENGKTK